MYGGHCRNIRGSGTTDEWNHVDDQRGSSRTGLGVVASIGLGSLNPSRGADRSGRVVLTRRSFEGYWIMFEYRVLLELQRLPRPATLMALFGNMFVPVPVSTML
jgi:hypothetical protein